MAFSPDHALLADLLDGDASARLPRALRLLQSTGGLWALGRASVRQLERRGFAAGEAARLYAALRLGARAAARPKLPARVTSPEEALACVARLFAGATQERFVVIVLDVKNRPVHVEVVAEGGDDACPVDPRAVFRIALLEHGASVLVAHNHPSGDATPSADDLELTQRLAAVGALMGLPLVDHLVVASIAPPVFTSLTARGVVSPRRAYRGRRR